MVISSRRARIARCTSRRTSSSGRRSIGSVFLRRTRGSPIVPLPTTRRRNRRRRPPPVTLLRASVGPIAGPATTTPTRAGILLTLLLPRHARHSSGSSRKITSSNRNRSRSTKCNCTPCRSRRAQLNPRPCSRYSHARNTANRSQGRGS